MIGLLDQNVSPNPWGQQQQRDQQQQPHRPKSTSHSPPMKGLDAMDEEVEDEEIQLPLKDEDNNEEYEYRSRYEPMDLDDEIIIECDNEHMREIRERKRTISMKLKETVEAFRRMNGMTHGGSSSSSGGDVSAYSPNRNPKLSNKMSSTESGVECNGDLVPPNNVSRRESLSVYGAEAKREHMRPRRQTITSKWPPATRRNNKLQPGIISNGLISEGVASTDVSPLPSAALDEERKFSNDSQFVDDYEMDADEDFAPQGHRGRRFSVPEKVLREANFAIFRQKDRVLQCLRAFSCYDEPLKQFMQSVTSYDIAPLHAAVCVVDGGLSVRKAVIAYCSTGLCAALIINTDADDSYDILTLTDCIQIFRIVCENPELAEIQLREFYAKHMPNRKKIIYSPTTQTVWDVARMFRLNRVHRIPVVHSDSGKFNGEQPNLLFFISLRSIFSEVVIKVMDSKAAITPNFNQLKLQDSKIGTWDNIIQAHENTKCAEIIDILLDKKISCLPLYDDDGFITGIITKQDIMNTVADYKTKPFSHILNVPAHQMINDACIDFLVTSDCTVEGAIRTLYDSNLPCLFVVDNNGEKVIGVISYADIMDFLLKLHENPQIMKAANGIRSRINSIAQANS
jgi:5'-AMP-activated protein kinase regulatory gamma subunit